MHRLLSSLVVLSLLAGLSACTTTQRIQAETGLAKALISNEQEQKLGLQVRDELQKQGVQYINDPQVVDYVRGVANRLLPFATKDRPEVKWEVQVINDPKTVNAFATPGGYLYVYSGLLNAADNEAELAGVLGHEMGHVVARHSARQMVDTYGLEAILSLAMGQNPSLLEKIAGSIAANGALLAHSRADEDEADTYGARYASAAGYDPMGIVHFFEKLKAQEGKTPAILTWLSDHPATPERIQHLTAYIAENHLTGSDEGDTRLAPIKAKLKTIPAPPPPPAQPAQQQPAQ